MEGDAKENSCTHRKAQALSKAGWLKKAPGRLLATYKERYIQVESTEMVVYDNEDLQNCTERLNLENYDRCQEIRSGFKKKHRLILIRSPKSGNKVCNIKLQTHSAEDKEAWIKALSDAINQAKNKVLDEVKVDESSHLEHVTRSRPRPNRNRRPPTRIHMKEVAVVSSDGILRLDMDVEDAYMPEGRHQTRVDSNGVSEDTGVLVSPSSHCGRAETEWMLNGEEAEVIPPVRVIPMPPNRKCSPVPAPEDQPEDQPEDVGSEKEGSKPPSPPAREAKPQQKAGPPPLPGNKPTRSTSTIHPPESPPLGPESSQGQSPCAAVGQGQQGQSKAPGMKEEEEEEDHEEPAEEPQKTNKLTWDTCITEGAGPHSDPALEPSAVLPEHLEDVSSSASPAEQDQPHQEHPPEAALLSGCRNTGKKSESSDEEGGAPGHENISASFTEALRSSTVSDDELHLPLTARLQPSAKVRSASSGDLLSDPPLRPQADSRRAADNRDDVPHLQSEVSVGMEETSELLCRVSHADGQKVAEDLLTEAMEKLRAAECVLRKVNTLHLTHVSPRRKSC